MRLEMMGGGSTNMAQHAILRFGSAWDCSDKFVTHKLKTLISMSDSDIRVVDMRAFTAEVDNLTEENLRLQHEVNALKRELTRVQPISSAPVPCIAVSDGETQTDDDMVHRRDGETQTDDDMVHRRDGETQTEDRSAHVQGGREGAAGEEGVEGSPAFKRPRGRTPMDVEGRKKVWDTTRGAWVEVGKK